MCFEQWSPRVNQAIYIVTEAVKLPTYHCLRTSVFSSVEINIRGDMGQLIPFTSGIVRVTLLFRRRAIL